MTSLTLRKGIASTGWTSLLFVGLLLLSGCFPEDPNQLEKIDREEAIEIAKHDADSAYGDISMYDIVIDTVGDRWKIDFVTNDSSKAIKGPHYLIAKLGGRFVMKHYDRDDW